MEGLWSQYARENGENFARVRGWWGCQCQREKKWDGENRKVKPARIRDCEYELCGDGRRHFVVCVIISWVDFLKEGGSLGVGNSRTTPQDIKPELFALCGKLVFGACPRRLAIILLAKPCRP